MWNLEGLRVEGLYMGEFPVEGRVELSRVALQRRSVREGLGSQGGPPRRS